MNNRETSTNADQSPRLRRPKSREVSSRFLPNSTAPIPSPSRSPISLIRRSPGSSADPRKHRSLEDSAFIRRLCPSPAAPLNRKTGTLFNHLKEERSKDVPSGKNEKKAANSVFLARQNNCRELNSWESRERKENHKPIVGGSMRYTGNIGFSEKFTAPACESSSSGVLRRLSANETAIKRSSSFRRESETFKDYNIDSESECSSLSTSASSLSPMRVANLVRVHGSKTPHWDWAPKRSSLSPESGENRGKLMHNPTSKPQKSTHSRTKGVGSLLSLGLELFRGRKSSSPARTGAIEALHQLRLLHCREIQWRFANAISDAVNKDATDQAESNLFNAWDSLQKLQYSVQHKKLQLQKEKLDRKLDLIIHSQMKALEACEDLEMQHLLAVSVTKECLHSVVCRVPLMKGAKAEPESVGAALGNALALAASTKSVLITFTPMAEEAVQSLSELAEVVAMEKSLLQECFQYIKMISMLETLEGSLRCALTQFNLTALPDSNAAAT